MAKGYVYGNEAYDHCPIARIQIKAINITIYNKDNYDKSILKKELEIKKEMLKNIEELRKSHLCDYCKNE